MTKDRKVCFFLNKLVNLIFIVLSLVRPYVKDVLMEVLKLISATQVDDLPPVVDSLLENFEEEVIPVAYDVAVELVRI